MSKPSIYANVPYFPECVYKHQFLSINQHYLPDENVQNATKLYLRPCNEMTAAISTTKYTAGNSNKLILQFNFMHEAYKVSQNYTIIQPTPFNDSFTYLLGLRYWLKFYIHTSKHLLTDSSLFIIFRVQNSKNPEFILGHLEQRK